MKAIAIGVALAALALAGVATSAEPTTDGFIRWEYRVLTRAQVLELGKQDLTAGLNKLGDEGWELAGVDGPYIFKRLKDQVRRQADEIRRHIAIAEADVESWKERVTWAERMSKKGYMSATQLQAERAQLTQAELVLDAARKALKSIIPDRKEPGEKQRKPEK
jgi:hypothetical protein